MVPELSALSRGLRAAVKDLAEVTASATISFEGGDYERVYIKPNFRLGSSLLTSREVLVLVTAFRDLQTRTIRMAESCLAEAKGRLEPGMAIVVHLDPKGDERLRVWGRERGLTILPIYADRGIPAGEPLQQTLCAGLYNHDPFDLAGPVRAAHQFFGRTDIPDIARRLRSGHIQAIFGIRKIGKTSVLNRILDEARTYHGMACAMADCSDDSLSALDAGALLDSIAAAVNDAASYAENRYASTIPLAQAVSAAEAARTLIDILVKCNSPTLLLIDELDYITPSSPVAAHWTSEFNVFFRALRSVYQECSRRAIPFSIVLCGVSSRWFTEERIGGVENSALAFVPETYLPTFERSQSIEMIQALGRSAGLVFSHGASDIIAETCSDMPFWIRKAGSFINSCFANSERPLKLRHPDIFDLTQEFILVEGGQLASSSLRHLFRIFPELGDVALAALKREPVDPYPQSLVSALGRYGLLGVGFEPSGPMVEAGLELWAKEQALTPRQLPFESGGHSGSPQDAAQPASPSDAVNAGSVSAAGEEEWADLLSEVSRLRNILERDLRDFVLTVIRLECAQRNDGRRPADILSSAVKLERRELLQGKTATNALKAMYWPELVAVIKKQWPWFERYFSDRRQVDLWADVINDRPDAHAKELDGAELALQRRAIQWFQERLQSASLL